MENKNVKAAVEGHKFKVYTYQAGKRVLAPCKVGPKCDTNEGHWICCTHHEGFDNQMMKDSHIHDPDRKHVLAWWCRQHGAEVP